jgi:hypothetical protein
MQKSSKSSRSAKANGAAVNISMSERIKKHWEDPTYRERVLSKRKATLAAQKAGMVPKGIKKAKSNRPQGMSAPVYAMVRRVEALAGAHVRENGGHIDDFTYEVIGLCKVLRK